VAIRAKWSIYRWIEGDTAAPERIGDLSGFAASLARFSSPCNASTRRTDLAPGRTTFAWRVADGL